MKKVWKRLLTGIMATVLVVTGLPMQQVLAAADIKTNDTSDQMKSVSTNSENEEYLLNYVTIEKPYLETPNVQKVVASIGEAECTYQTPILIYKNQETGEYLETEAEKTENSTALFTIEHRQTEAAVYSLEEIRFEADGEKHRITFDECGINAAYGVNKTIGTEACGEYYTEEESESVHITITDSEGNTISDQSLGEILKEAEGAVPIAFAGARSISSTDAFEDEKLVVVLDPGHDNQHSGATYFGVNEQELTLKIAKYCKEELEKYIGVEVYLTRETGNCAWGNNVALTDCLEYRAEFALQKRADIFVSIHLNANESSSPKGAEIYYPNANYRPDIGAEGQKVAQAILDELGALGIDKRGIKVVNANEDKYPDGSAADYYKVIRECKKRGIPGLIVEHAFLSNADDYKTYLSSDEKLKKLGVADAAAIASYYGLTEADLYNPGDAKLEVSFGEDGSECQIRAAEIPNSHGVQFAVWSQSSNEADKKWYTANKDEDGNWNTSFALSDFKKAGDYQVQCYIMRANGSKYYVGEAGFKVTGPSAASMEITNKNEVAGTWDVILSGVTSQAEIQKVQIGVWGQGNQSDLKWYTASKQSDGNYLASIDIANHMYYFGTYQMHVYVLDKNGISVCVKASTINFEKKAAKFDVTANETGRVYTVYGSNVAYTGSVGVQSVQYGVWSNAGGQDDLKWYKASLNEKNQWTADVDIQNHKTAGIYQVHTYVNLKNGTSIFTGATTFNVTGPKASGILFEKIDNESGKFDIKVTEVSSPAGIRMVQLAVWSAPDQSNLKWYTAQRDVNGNYVVNVDIINHKYQYGIYQVHVYAMDENGIQVCVGASSLNYARPSAKFEVDANETGTVYTICGSNIAYTESAGVQSVQYGVWSNIGGQDDLKWYKASLNEKNQWTADVNIQNHKTAGTYQVHTYVNLKNGTSVFAGATTFNVTGPKASGIVVDNIDYECGKFDIRITGVSSPAGIRTVQGAVWSASNQKDLKWYTAQCDVNGDYVVKADIANHQYNYGVYQIHVYASDANGISTCIGITSLKFAIPSAKFEVNVNETGTVYTICGSNIAYTGSAGVQSVQYGVWSNAGGQDDLKWYTATVNKNRQWTADVSISNHKTAGDYQVHTYVNLKNGTSVFVGATSFFVQGPKASLVEVVNLDEANGSFQVKVSGVTSGAHVSAVQVAVWCSRDQSDMVWYDATRLDDCSWIVYADVINHKKNLGVYYAHVYAFDNNGVSQCVGAATCQMLNVTNAYFNIVGSSAVTKAQLVSYYKANETYPAFYAGTDAPTIEDFCQIYLEECKAEGIKVEVAFCQAMKETGFLRYLGDAKIEQFNFAGLDTTGKKPDGTVDRGRSYSNVREGIRAHIQRLKAWAVKGTTPDSYKYPCIDADKFDSNWWVNTIIGSAPYVEWLGKYQNPSGYGWAVDPNYGYSIKNDYLKKLLSY